MMVSDIGDGVTELAGHLIEVDLQDNLFSRWDEIIILASHLPVLTNLLLHGNKIGNLTFEFLEKTPLARYVFLICKIDIFLPLFFSELASNHYN